MQSTPLFVRVALILLSAVVITACGGGRGDSTPSRSIDLPSLAPVLQGLPTVDRRLLEIVQQASPEDDIQVVVTFPGKSSPSEEQRGLLYQHGVTRGLYFKHLPIAGVLAKPDQIRALMEQRGLRSLWHNAELSYEDEVARALTGVDATINSPVLKDANGNAIDGSGITILVNDSGVDATHPDLQFGSKVVENVMGQTSLQLLAATAGVENEMIPHTPLEGVPNGDLLGSHGTHVAGIAAGDGSQSGGRFAGVARGANIIGYGSGAAILVLDSLGGFDYAAEVVKNRPELNLRIVTNSFGSTGDQGTDFDPADPTNIATKILTDLGLVVVFSAGNSGSGPSSITGNFKKAPWVLVAANGTKEGLLAPSSSRGALAGGEYQVEVDGETFTVEDRPLVVTPGTDYIAARAVAADPFTPLDLQADLTGGDIPPELVPFYTAKSGTSMAAPHLAGLVAMLLQVNPELTWRELKTIFKSTATSIPGYEPWEVGAGYANIEAAVAMAQGRNDYGSLNHLTRSFVASVGRAAPISEQVTLDFIPAGEPTTAEFEVGAGIALVIASWSLDETNPCTCGVTLTDPEGNRHGSGIALPLLAPRVAATAPGMPGTWTVEFNGIGGLSGVTLDPLGLTNGISPPSMGQEVLLEQFPQGNIVGLSDTVGHPQQSIIQSAIAERLMDSRPSGLFEPDALLARGEFAEYVTAFGVRQTRSHDGGRTQVMNAGQRRLSAAVEIATRGGNLILDLDPEARAPIETGMANPQGAVSLEEAAFALIQAKGDEDAAAELADATGYIDADGNAVLIGDIDAISPTMRGHVVLALQLGVLQPEVQDGVAFVRPQQAVSRADYAAMALRAMLTIPFPS
nr:S8 family serine peptidase [Oceanococcus sp. HetDA_MAG_MS8]